MSDTRERCLSCYPHILTTQNTPEWRCELPADHAADWHSASIGPDATVAWRRSIDSLARAALSTPTPPTP